MSDDTVHPNVHPHTCPTCGTGIAFDAQPIALRQHLDFLLAEMQKWTERERRLHRWRVGYYEAWRRQIDQQTIQRMLPFEMDFSQDLPSSASSSVSSSVSSGSSSISSSTSSSISSSVASKSDQPETSDTRIENRTPTRREGRPEADREAATGAPGTSPSVSPWARITEMMEAHNIATLHLVGSLLLLTGLFVLVRLQWDSWGKQLLLLLLIVLSSGLSVAGNRLSRERSTSGLILSALGALILPLNFVALYLFGFLSGIVGPPGQQSGAIVGLVGAFICGTVYMVTMWRTRHPFFATLTALTGIFVAWFTARLLPNEWGGYAYANAFLPFAVASFHTTYVLKRAGERQLARPFAYVAHLAMAIGLGYGSLVGSPGDHESLKRGLLAAVSAAIYADAATRIRIPWLAYIASLVAFIAGLLVIEWEGGIYAQTMMIMVVALCLYRYGLQLDRRASLLTDEEAESKQCHGEVAQIFRRVGEWGATATLALMVLTVSASLLALQPANQLIQIGEILVVALVGGYLSLHGLFHCSPRRRTIYTLIASLFILIADIQDFLSRSLLHDIHNPWLLSAGITCLCCLGSLSLLKRWLPSEPIYSQTLEAVGRVLAPLTALLPWCYIGWGDTAVRATHLCLVLPGLAILNWLQVREQEHREWNVHLLNFTLGSLSLFIGASSPLPFEERVLWATLGGSLMASLWVGLPFQVGALRSVRAILTGDAQILSLVSFLPIPLLLMAPGLLSDKYIWPTIGVLSLQTLVWVLTAIIKSDGRPLYGAGFTALLAGWLWSVPLDQWATRCGFAFGQFLLGGGLLVLMPFLFVVAHLALRYEPKVATRDSDTENGLAENGLTENGLTENGLNLTDVHAGGMGFAPPLFHIAQIAALLGCAGQALHAMIGSVPLASGGIKLLWIVALGGTLYGWLGSMAKEKEWVGAFNSLMGATAPLLVGYFCFMGRHFSLFAGQPWLCSPWFASLTFGICGICWLTVACRKEDLLLLRGGAIFCVVAWLHGLGEILPPGMHSAWALGLMPLYLIFYFYFHLYGGLPDRVRTGMRTFLFCAAPTTCFLYIVSMVSRMDHSNIAARPFAFDSGATRLSLLTTVVIYAGGVLADAIFRADTSWLWSGMVIGTVGISLWAAGFPYAWMHPSQVGLMLALMGVFWYGATLPLARIRPNLANSMTEAGLLCAGIGALSALWGAFYTDWDHGKTTTSSVSALLIAAGVFATRWRQIGDNRWGHLAFTSAFGAFAVYLWQTLGVGIDKIDLYCMPLGIYLICLGGHTLYNLRRHSRGDEQGQENEPDNRQNGDGKARSEALQAELHTATWLSGMGIVLLLGPSLLASIYDTGGLWHSFLLVAECLLAVAFGIFYRIRLFVGFGMAFLVALLAVKAYHPGEEKSFALYLTVLGAITLVCAILIDRYRKKGA